MPSPRSYFMRRSFFWTSLLAAPLLISPLACSKPQVKRPPPTDPLLMSKTPVSARYGRADNPDRPDPAPPAMPAGAWVRAPSPGNGTMEATLPAVPAPGPFHWTSEKKPGALEQQEGTHKLQQMQG